MEGRKEMDMEITRWIIEFLLRQPITTDFLINKILTNTYIPLANDNPRLKKTILLRSIESAISDGTVSEKILDALELAEEIDRNDGIKIPDSMKAAYCAVAVECTVKYLGGTPRKRRGNGGGEGEGGRYFEAVERIWRERVEGLERGRMSELVTEDLREWKDEIEAAVWDWRICERLLERNTRNEALRLVGVYLGEAKGIMGPPFLELVARVLKNEVKAKVMGDSVEGNVRPESVVSDSPIMKETEKKNVLHKRKHAAFHKHHRGQVRIADPEELDVDKHSSKYDTLPTPEVNKVQEALKSSSTELQAVVKDPLPDALHLAGSLFAETASKILNQETSVENKNGKSVDEPNPYVDSLISDVARKAVNHDSSLETHNGQDVNGHNPSLNQTVEPVQPGEANTGNPSCSHQNGIPKPSLMERNSTARTYEWDDSIDGLSEDSPNRMTRFHLDSPKRETVSPLKKYEIMKLARRRKKKRWSVEEEDALREAVQKFGKGNWKLILNSKRDIFVERTEVDLKDKWRNMTRY